MLSLTVASVSVPVDLPGDLGFRTPQPGDRYASLAVAITNTTSVEQPYSALDVVVLATTGRALNYSTLDIEFITARTLPAGATLRAQLYVEALAGCDLGSVTYRRRYEDAVIVEL